MPSYNYQCKKCDVVFSIFQKMSDEPISNCKVCNSLLKRIISGGSGMIFKGNGFYITDYSKSKNKKDKNSNKNKTKEGNNNE
tara:strand:- start:372 stop:617 length:246 start_codon:yes stop_codon:yes gene_type:complete